MAGLIKRGKSYYAVFYLAGRQERRSLGTRNYQIAKAKLIELERSLARGDDHVLPSETPLSDIVADYIEHIRINKTPRSFRTDLWYLRDTFGPICEALQAIDRKTKKCKPRGKRAVVRRDVLTYIRVTHLEDLTTSDLATFIDLRACSRGHCPKTSNRYREVVMRLINWAAAERGVRMRGGLNPALKVRRRRVPAPVITFLRLEEIQAQLNALSDRVQLQTMVAVLIYAGLRREEMLQLTLDDVDLSAGECGLLRVRAKEIDGKFWQPKTKSNRVVPISRALREYLGGYKPRPNKGKWYFPSPDGKKWDGDNFASDLRAVNDKAELTWTSQVYRHTFGSHLAMRGESLYKIATLMGNSPEICMRHYAALIPEALTDTVEFDVLRAKANPRAGLRVIRRDGSIERVKPTVDRESETK